MSPPKRSTSIRWPEHLREEIQQYADKERETFSTAVIKLVEKGLEEKRWEQRVLEKARKDRYSPTNNSDNDSMGGSRQAQ